MISRIAGLAATVATISTLASGTAAAAPQPACPASITRPCVWQQPSTEGVVGAARLDTADHTRPTLLRVEVRIQRAWGRPWETVASSTLVATTGTLSLTTPAVRTDYRTIVCATGGPADAPELHSTNCTL
ncbi:hypothetical protein [Streptomyces sp. NRRL B-24484]|uniref:hypothetical protein n=1 Tax=Streptomyces sp. NRRL B-24484 TaxID=1463833 RepID=UPI0013319544|nr:hypothetical protein [Streptomyces sp. NRRL B-24484]